MLLRPLVPSTKGGGYIAWSHVWNSRYFHGNIITKDVYRMAPNFPGAKFSRFREFVANLENFAQ